MSLFDGMAGLLCDVMGGPVIWQPLAGAETEITSVFREEPMEVLGTDEFPVIVSQPTWRVAADRVEGWQAGDLIQPGNGKTYRIANAVPSASPADDGMMLFRLEVVS